MKEHRYVEIELDKPRKMRLSAGALIAFEKATNKSFAEISLAGKSPSMTDINTILWASLLHEEPKLTPGQVAEWYDIGDLPYIADKVNELVNGTAKEGETPLA